MSDSRSLASELSAAFDDDEIEFLREDPFEAMSLVVPAVSIELVQHALSSDCSVEGIYYEGSRSIEVQRSRSYRRTKFTALHELGHDQARHTPAVARALSQLSEEGSRRYEEQIANAFAAAILVPDAAVDEILEGRQPTAHDVVKLFKHLDVGGSREACCVRMAQRMRGVGYVVLGEGEVLRYSEAVGTPYRVRRGTRQGADHLIARAAVQGSAVSTSVRLRHPSGAQTPAFSGQAVRDDEYVFAVLTDATDLPWGGWVAPRKAEAVAPEIFCADCDEVSDAWGRCEDDPRHRVCSACSWCECKKPKAKMVEKTCDTCFLPKQIDLFADGSGTCRDCL